MVLPPPTERPLVSGYIAMRVERQVCNKNSGLLKVCECVNVGHELCISVGTLVFDLIYEFDANFKLRIQ